MKRTLLFILASAAATALSTALVAAAPVSIVNSKHNLSAVAAPGKGTIHADPDSFSQTSEICVFCHTPHHSRSDAPLWNRTLSSSAVVPYTSDVLTGLGYPAADDPNAVSNKAHIKTRLCLSCHDGTIALGNLMNLPYSGTSRLFGDIVMTGTTDQKMPTASQGYIGLNMSDDHPVAIKLDVNQDIQELKTPTGAVNLYNALTGKPSKDNGDYVECTSCHNAHDNQYGNFLVEPNTGSALCLKCHNKTGFAAGVHANATGAAHAYAPPTSAPTGSTTLGAKVGDVKCMVCHFPHKAGITDASQLPLANEANFASNPRAGVYLLSFQEEMSCFNNPNRWKDPNPVTVCHGSGTGLVSGNVAAEVGRSYAHRVGDQSGVHRATEVRTGVSAGWFSTNKHVECDDCHNSHTAGADLHTQGSNLIGTTTTMYGTGYARVNVWGALWTPTAGANFTPVDGLGVTTNHAGWPADVKEYEVCFKCHSNFAVNGAPFPNSPSDLQAMTDQSKEFTPANLSYHPVVQKNNNAGQYDPPNGSFKNGWTSSSLMYCSDCHTSNVIGSRPRGPHGSQKPFILAFDYLNTYSTVTNGSQDDQDSTSLCLQCHEPAVYNTYATGDGTAGTAFMTNTSINLHNRHKTNARTAGSGYAYRCVNCHVKVPHGWGQRKAMIIATGDPDAARYSPAGGPLIAPGPSLGSLNTYNTGKNVNCTTNNAACH